MRRLFLSCAVLAIGLKSAVAQASVEGRVELPKTRSAPVATKRYEIVTKGGVLATSPPLAVVYLEGSFSKAGVLPTKQIVQKDLMFTPTLLPVRVGTCGCGACLTGSS